MHRRAEIAHVGRMSFALGLTFGAESEFELQAGELLAGEFEVAGSLR